MFQFTGSPSAALWIYATVTRVFRAGFPHSDIRGSRCICHSPRLFAACHVFRRLLVPRHPPCALYACPASAIHLAINKWPLKSLLNSFLRKEKTSSFDVFSYLILCIQFSRCDTDEPCKNGRFYRRKLACGRLKSDVFIRRPAVQRGNRFAIFELRMADFAAFVSKGSGSHLASHVVSNVVLSAASGLTVVFGMGTGVTPRRIATGSSFCTLGR